MSALSVSLIINIILGLAFWFFFFQSWGFRIGRDYWKEMYLIEHEYSHDVIKIYEEAFGLNTGNDWEI